MRHHKALMIAVLAVAAAAPLGGCSGLESSESSESQASKGTIQLPLTAYGNTGTQYRLTLATFQIASAAGTTATLSSDLDPTASSVDATLAVGSYAVALASGWQMQQLVGDTWTNVAATLVSAASQSFAVAENGTTVVVYAFTANGEIVTTSVGQVSVRMTVSAGGASSGGTSTTAGGTTGGSSSLCITSDQRCNGNILEVCSSARQWETKEVCAQTCDSTGTTAQCIAAVACSPNSRQCVGNIAQVCDTTGSAWLTVETCAAGCSGGLCTGICTPGAARCVGDVPEVCDATGTQWTAGAACAGSCSNGTCG